MAGLSQPFKQDLSHRDNKRGAETSARRCDSFLISAPLCTHSAGEAKPSSSVCFTRLLGGTHRLSGEMNPRSRPSCTPSLVLRGLAQLFNFSYVVSSRCRCEDLLRGVVERINQVHVWKTSSPRGEAAGTEGLCPPAFAMSHVQFASALQDRRL